MDSSDRDSSTNGQANPQYQAFSFQHYGNATQMNQMQGQQVSNQTQPQFMGQIGQIQQPMGPIKPAPPVPRQQAPQAFPMIPPPLNANRRPSMRQTTITPTRLNPSPMPPPQPIHMPPVPNQSLPQPSPAKRKPPSTASASAKDTPSITSTDSGPPKKKKATAKAPPKMSDAQQKRLLQASDWQDRTLWMSKILMGGQAINGFLRSTAATQRIKRQRARQLKIKPPEDSQDPQQDEEVLKKQVMNVKTAKRLKTELDAGMAFCKFMHETVCGILRDMGGVPVPPAIGSAPPKATKTSSSRPPSAPRASSKVSAKSSASGTAANKSHSTGGPNESTLRKSRKKKLPPNKENMPKLIDGSGKRLYGGKKEHTYRVFEVLRFRSLRQGELVAARISSRDLWILGRVARDYMAGNDNMAAMDFLQLTDTQRQQLFKDMVMVQDVEDDTGLEIAVQRNLVLPLPRHFSEAADWGSRCKKGFRVYAMYPQTTSLYTATVVDNTTYCHGDDDIIVVEFDGDEPNETGKIPQCHIPARFVTLVPREFPGANTTSQAQKGGNSSDTDRKGKNSAPSVARMSGSEELMGEISMEGMSSFGDFDLDLDLGLT